MLFYGGCELKAPQTLREIDAELIDQHWSMVKSAYYFVVSSPLVALYVLFFGDVSAFVTPNMIFQLMYYPALYVAVVYVCKLSLPKRAAYADGS